MTNDQTLTRKCAEAIGLTPAESCGDGGMWCCFTHAPGDPVNHRYFQYNPLKDDTQVMGLVRRFRLDVRQQHDGRCRATVLGWDERARKGRSARSKDVSRAIVMCVAKMGGPR